MTNLEIIGKAKQQAGIEEECHTYQTWKHYGKQVQKGEKAKLTLMIWKPVKAKEAKEEQEDVPNMILVKAYFFTESQVK